MLQRPQIRFLVRLLFYGFATLCTSSVALASVVLFDPDEPVDFPPNPPPIEIDINGDAVIDYIFTNNFSAMIVEAQSGNRAITDDRFGIPYGSALVDGGFIGADPGVDRLWQGSNIFLGGCVSAGGLSCSGNFLGGFDYLGLEFQIDGATHYGWIEIESFPFFGPVNFQRWAYESEPGVPILAGAVPEPTVAPLLLLALGLFLRRNR